jgi:tetratricopeptide (TPR) repeat protein
VNRDESALDPAAERAMAVELYNRVWSLLDEAELSVEQRDEVVHCAHASAWHWSRVGTVQNRAIGEWQISRVYASLGRPEPAVHHAHRAFGRAEEVGDVPWLLASAYEGLARAYAAAGDVETARQWRDRAMLALDQVDDPEDREIVEKDIAALPDLD